MVDCFKDTVFYPKLDSDVKPMNQCIESGLPVFAYDINKKTNAKGYYSCGYEHFCFSDYKRLKTKHVYELLQLNKPTKVFLDFDNSVDVENVEKFEEGVEKFISIVSETLGNDETTGKPYKYYVLDASTKEKLSKHVIFECFLEDIYAVKDFVLHCTSFFDYEHLDTAIYSMNRVFRLIYSYKMSKCANSRLYLKDTHKDYNPYDVFKTMIQAKIPPNYTGPFDKIRTELSTSIHTLKIARSSNYKRGVYTVSSLQQLPKMLYEYIESVCENVYIHNSCKETDDSFQITIKGIVCPWAGRVHKGNNAYFNVRKRDMMSWFQCADLDCPRTCWNKRQLTFIS